MGFEIDDELGGGGFGGLGIVCAQRMTCATVGCLLGSASSGTFSLQRTDGGTTVGDIGLEVHDGVGENLESDEPLSQREDDRVGHAPTGGARKEFVGQGFADAIWEVCLLGQRDGLAQLQEEPEVG